jgi:GntR family transcriptional regulator, trigonelline degradation regulator
VTDVTTETGAPRRITLQRVAAPLREQVLELLRNDIVEQRLRPGHRLIERELIEQIGVSRTTIREVLRQLAAEGLVTTIPQKGAVVTALSREEAQDLYEVRAALEALAARRFAQRAAAEQVTALRRSFTAFERLTNGGAETPELLRAKNAFYDVLLEGSQNKPIHSILGGLRARVALLRTTSLSQEGRPARALNEIREIVEAIEASDPERAADAAAHHVQQAAQTALGALAPHTGEPETTP